jgi:hypothetical protein
MLESILWGAEHAPNIGGMSPVTWGMHSDQGGEVVIDIMQVDSVDLVDRPATTNGFYERENTDMDPKEVLKLQESLLAKTNEATATATKLQESEAKVADLTTKLAESEQKRLAAEGTLAAQDVAKKLGEKRAARLALIPADLPADVITDKFKEAVIAAADDATALVLVETVKQAHGAPRSVNSGATQGKESVSTLAEAKAKGLTAYSKGF